MRSRRLCIRIYAAYVHSHVYKYSFIRVYIYWLCRRNNTTRSDVFSFGRGVRGVRYGKLFYTRPPFLPLLTISRFVFSPGPVITVHKNLRERGQQNAFFYDFYRVFLFYTPRSPQTVHDKIVLVQHVVKTSLFPDSSAQGRI